MLTLFKRKLESEIALRTDDEIARQMDTARQASAVSLRDLIAEQATSVAPLRKARDAAQATLDANNVIRAEAEKRDRLALHNAEGDLRAADYGYQRRIDALKSLLEGELQPRSIGDALAELNEIFEANRVYIEGCDRSKLLAWCRDARQQLLDLQMQPSDNIDSAVSDIMASRPS